MSDVEQEGLQPCPCGNVCDGCQLAVAQDKNQWWSVISACGWIGPARSDRDTAVRDWNRRADPWAEECLHMIKGVLMQFGCKCSPDAHEDTPPMCYPEWIACVVHSAVAKDRAALKEAKERLKELHFHADPVRQDTITGWLARIAAIEKGES